jgi:hypothetical protein
MKKSLYEMVNDVIKFRHSNGYLRKLTHAYVCSSGSEVLHLIYPPSFDVSIFLSPLLPIGFIFWF